MYFYETFNSIAVKDPLKLAFNEIYARYQDSLEVVDAFKAIKLALTLDSKRTTNHLHLQKLLRIKIFLKIRHYTFWLTSHWDALGMRNINQLRAI